MELNNKARLGVTCGNTPNVVCCNVKRTLNIFGENFDFFDFSVLEKCKFGFLWEKLFGRYLLFRWGSKTRI
ncbi:hypothetical protein [uncultured Fibrobacter sp.]|uniref:hypothetical protein n=1 Tax=uncultured Fibrobacter sp. TaxID=261512 RepID=UPI002597D368|nr:hypothetical protein [uncultured Fibrobacter sp.]